MSDPITYSVGDITLDVSSRALSGPRGRVELASQLYSIAERLMRRPTAIIEVSDIITAMYADPDGEPENSEVVMRGRLTTLRGIIAGLSRGRVRIRSEVGIGYSIEVVR